MQHILFVVALLSAVVSAVSSPLPQHSVQACSASEWLWDTFVKDLGCSF